MAIMQTYRVHMQRVDPKAGTTSNFSFDVKAESDRMARLTAESQYRGYRATGAHRII